MSDPSPNVPSKPEIVEVPQPKHGPKSVEPRFTAASFAGPLPPPDLLASYEQACPGLADRIVKMAESEAEHRRSLEVAMLRLGEEQSRSEFAEGKRGQLCAITIAIVGLFLAAYVALQGHEITGGILGVSGISGIVTAFLVGKRGAGEEGQAKADDQQPKREQKSRRQRKQS